MSKTKEIIPNERIINRIFLIRGKKVMFDKDLAQLYGVETRTLNQAVRRNKERFPDDFMFQLTKEEFRIWASQIVIPNDKDRNLRSQTVISSYGGRRYIPYVFTEQGIAMLSSVLKSKRAIQTNIAIMRTFAKLREFLLTHKELREKIEKLEKRYDKQFKVIFDVIKKLISEKREPYEQIGFRTKN
ncbi:ORF6N domain-containing protein [Patescibacteria group bacterium]|nr:ORF6N domain-containing protein [Patescibacteria group bacterium]